MINAHANILVEEKKGGKLKKTAVFLLAVIVFLSFAACSKEKERTSSQSKKNQVVYVEKSAQYGDLKITFLEYELKHMSTGTYPRIHLLIENNGDDKFEIYANDFEVFADNNDMGSCDSDYSWTDGRAGNCTNKRLELHPGRNGEIWINYTRRDISDYNIIEFDYVYSPFAKQWGKITFAINLNDGVYNQIGISENLDPDKAIIGTWQFMDTQHEYADDFFRAYTFYDDNTGVSRINSSVDDFTYYLVGNTLYINSEYIGDCEFDGKYLSLVHRFGNVATSYYYEKIEDYYADSNESLVLDIIEPLPGGIRDDLNIPDPKKAIIGTWELYARTAGDVDPYLVSISIYNDETCWCQYNDGTSEHFLYEFLDLIDGNWLWLYNDSQYVEYEINYINDECLILSYCDYDSLSDQSFEGRYAKTESRG